MSGDDVSARSPAVPADAAPGARAAAAPAFAATAPAAPRPTAGAPLFVVLNAGSGPGGAAETRERIEAACRAHARRVEILIAERPSQLGAIATTAVERATAAGGIVVAAGGDGTINTVAQAVLASGCSFGVLPHGTFNYFGRVHGIAEDRDEALRQLLTEDARPVRVGLVNDKAFLVNASLGLYPRLLEDREAYKKQYGRSRLVAFGAGLMTMLGAHPHLSLRIDADGATRALRTPTLFVGNNALQLAQIGVAGGRGSAGRLDAGRIDDGSVGSGGGIGDRTGVDVSVDAGVGVDNAGFGHGHRGTDVDPSLDSDDLVAIAVRPVGRWAMAWLLLRGAVGRLGDAERVESFAFRAMDVVTAGRAGRRIKVATDGEVAWMRTPLRFAVAPAPLWLVKPATPGDAG